MALFGFVSFNFHQISKSTWYWVEVHFGQRWRLIISVTLSSDMFKFSNSKFNFWLRQWNWKAGATKWRYQWTLFVKRTPYQLFLLRKFQLHSILKTLEIVLLKIWLENFSSKIATDFKNRVFQNAHKWDLLDGFVSSCVCNYLSFM